MRVIDVHNHFYPPEYLQALKTSGSRVRITYDAEHNPLVHYPGDYNVLVRGHRDIDYRLQVMDEHKEDVQVITLTTPGVHVDEPPIAVKVAAITNDAFAGIRDRWPSRFAPLATLPLNDPDASRRELIRAMDDLKLPGAMLFSNVNGVALDDRRYWPLYEEADARAAVFMIHPTSPVGVEAMTEYWLMPLNGFVFDTTLAASKLVFSGTVKRFPRIRWILGHLGGTIPYIAERLDRGWRAYADCRVNIDELPTAYLKRHFWYDTVNFSTGPLRLAIDFAGADRILAGSDYPHMIGSIPLMKESVETLALGEKVTEAVMARNAAKLLGLEGGEDGSI